MGGLPYGNLACEWGLYIPWTYETPFPEFGSGLLAIGS